MPKDPIAPLITANEKEKERTWEDLETPRKLASWFQRLFAVDLGTIKKQFNIYVGPNEPQGGDRGKIHFKTSRPIGIGALVQGKYEYIYQYPQNVPMQFSAGDVPFGLSELSAEELSKFGLTNTSNYTWAWIKE